MNHETVYNIAQRDNPDMRLTDEDFFADDCAPAEFYTAESAQWHCERMEKIFGFPLLIVPGI